MTNTTATEQSCRALTALSDRLDDLARQKREQEDAEPFDKQALENVFAQERETRDKWSALNRDFAADYALALGVRDAGAPANARVQIGGDPHQLSAEVERGFVEALALTNATASIPPHRSGRLELAHWLTHPANPLLARVVVNRVWHQLFGRGLVPTVDDFTSQGTAPSNPAPLDYLAVDFRKNGWSIKKLIRTIVLSRVYHSSTDHDPRNHALDPENQFLWRMNRRRLELEPLRDAILAVGGNLDDQRPTTLVDNEVDRVPSEPAKWPDLAAARCRTIYFPVLRRALPAMFEQFDFAPPAEVLGARSVTTVPTQALFLMNSPFVGKQSSAAAARLLQSTTGPTGRTQTVFLQTLGREPRASELQQVADYVEAATSAGLDELRIWTDIYHAQFSTAEFLYRN